MPYDFEKIKKPHDIMPTLLMFVSLTVLVDSIIGKTIATTDIPVQFLNPVLKSTLRPFGIPDSPM